MVGLWRGGEEDDFVYTGTIVSADHLQGLIKRPKHHITADLYLNFHV
jgi:hypothetical protein